MLNQACPVQDIESKWYFAITDEVAISFDRNKDDSVIAMKIHQSGLEIEIPREGVEIPPEIELDELQKYLGSYRSEEIGMTTKVLIQNNRLAVDVPGQMAFELYLPDEEGKWAFRSKKDIKVMFSESDADQIESMTLYQEGKEFEMHRVEAEPLPSVEGILALRDTESRKAALDKMGNYRLTGTIHSPQSGVTGTITVHVSGTNRYRVDSDYGKYGYGRAALNGGQAWVQSSFAPFDELHGKLLEQAKQGHPEATFGDWRDFFDSIHVLRSEELGERKVYVLEFKRGDLPALTIYVDATTGDVLKSEGVVLNELRIAIPVVFLIEDYREVDGIRIPFRTISSNEQTGRAITQYEAIESGLDIGDETFTLSPPTDS